MAQISHSSFNSGFNSGFNSSFNSSFNNSFLSEDELIEKNMGLVNSVVQTFNPPDLINFDEYLQAGRIGLLKAVRNYDESRGKFSTIAWHTIKWEILSHIDDTKLDTLPITQELTSGEITEDVTEYFPESLTAKELKVLNLRKEGHTFKSIGSILGKEFGLENGYSKSWANLIFHNSLDKIREANGICLT